MYKQSLFITEQKIPEGGVVLFSSSTGGVIKLDQEGADYWHAGRYNELDVKLLSNWRFIVPEGHDELEEQRNIRQIVSTMRPNRKVSYVIAPTMQCNAQCPYCFEESTCPKRAGLMTPETANAVADYILEEVVERGCSEVELVWFGGEPLLATGIIDTISTRLREGVDKYSATLVTNGSLLDKYQHRLPDWGIRKIQVTFDGSGEDYNRLKRYKNPECNNYEKVIANVKSVAKQYPHITTIIRVNFDESVSKDSLKKLLSDLRDYRENMMIYSRPVVDGETFGLKSEFVAYPTEEAGVETMLWFDKILAEQSFNQTKPRNAITPRGSHCPYYTAIPFAIDPEGYFYQCEHFLGAPEHAVGHIQDFSGWNEANATVDLPEKCYACRLLPTCQGGCEVAGEDARCAFQHFEVDSYLLRLAS